MQFKYSLKMLNVSDPSENADGDSATPQLHSGVRNLRHRSVGAQTGLLPVICTSHCIDAYKTLQADMDVLNESRCLMSFAPPGAGSFWIIPLILPKFCLNPIFVLVGQLRNFL